MESIYFEKLPLTISWKTFLDNDCQADCKICKPRCSSPNPNLVPAWLSPLASSRAIWPENPFHGGSDFEETCLPFSDISKICAHSDFNHITLDYHIALLRFESALLAFNDTMSSICLPTASTSFPSGTYCWVTGFSKKRPEVDETLTCYVRPSFLFNPWLTANSNIQFIPSPRACSARDLKMGRLTVAKGTAEDHWRARKLKVGNLFK